MRLIDLIPEADVLCALEPEELGLRMLAALANWREHIVLQHLTLNAFLESVAGRNAPEGRGQYPLRQRQHVEQAVREAWAWLEGSALLIKHSGFKEPNVVRMLSRRARQLAEEPDAKKVFAARRIPKEVLHPSIQENVWALFHRGKYDTAVFEAMKAVEVAVREAAGLSAKEIGTNLMRQAFDPQSGPLSDMSMEKAEREARSALFAGAIGSYKNPHSHRNVALDDPDEAAEIIALANHLLRVIDSRRIGMGTP